MAAIGAAAPTPLGAAAPAPLGDANAAEAPEEAPLFEVGELVEVRARTHPGMNKPGGTGTVRKVNDERTGDQKPMKDGSRARTTGFTYAVKYVLGGSEKRVDAQWISSKREVSRDEAADARRDAVAKQKAEREAREAARRAEEEARAERKRQARAKVAALREAKRLAAARAAPAAAAPSEAAPEAKKPRLEERAAPPPPPVPEEPEDVRWLRRVMASAPREAADEIELDALLARALASAPPPALGASDEARRAGTRALLADLEAANACMLVEGTVFLV